MKVGISAGIVLCGVISIGAAYLFQEMWHQPDANIGLGMLFLLGWVITAIGCISVLFTNLALWQKLTVLVILAGVITWNIISARQAEEASRMLYCRPKLESGQKLGPNDAVCWKYKH